MFELLFRRFFGRDDAPAAIGAAEDQPPHYSLVHQGGGWALLASHVFFWLAVASWLYAETGWFDATGAATSIGVGTSAYHGVEFERTVSLAALSAAAAVIAIAMRSLTIR